MSRVAICFFGLVKNIDHVYASIQKYILEPITRAGYAIDYYGHTYKIDRFTNPRNREANVPIHPESIRSRFTFKQFQMELPTDYSNLEADLKLCLKYGDPWPENKTVSLQNHLLNLRSLYQVTQLWKTTAADTSSRCGPTSGSAYKYVVYLRPDLRFVNPLQLVPLSGKSLVVPSFHSYGGCNDRFAYGTPEAMIIYGERWAGISAYFAKHTRSIHAETFLRLHLQDAGVSVQTSSLRFQRIRANNQPNPGDPKT